MSLISSRINNYVRRIKQEKSYPNNITNPAFPVVRTVAENTAETEAESFTSAVKGWLIFDMALKGIGIAYSKIKGSSIKLPEIIKKLFTPNQIGLELGLNAVNQSKGKVLPMLLTKPAEALKTAVGNVVGKEGIKAGTGSYFNSTLKPMMKFSGAPIMIAMEMLMDSSKIVNEFKEGFAPGLKQLGLSGVKGSINAVGFMAGDIAGSAIGAIIGGGIAAAFTGGAGTALGASIGGYIGKAVGIVTATYFSNKLAKSLIGEEEKVESKQEKPLQAIQQKPELITLASRRFAQ